MKLIGISKHQVIIMKFETVIGLEIHVQLATKSKLFSATSTKFGAEPNTQASNIDLGMPGVLPVLNEAAVAMAIKFGLAINAEIARSCVFARKNYFYPDLPKGYQISQLEMPIVGKGEIQINLADDSVKTIGVTRAHLEEDAGKSVHDEFDNMTGVDLNRAGTPLIEIVSEPDLRSAEQAVAYAKKIHSLIRYLEIGDANMQEGSFRMDVNISLRPFGQEQFGTRSEIKNLNSFKFMEKAIQLEYDRQSEILLSGGKVKQETRLYDATNDTTCAMRSKEEANDYRYFPDPDLLPVNIDPDFIKQIAQDLPELPEQKKTRLVNDYSISVANAEILTATKVMADFFETALKQVSNNPELLANWILGELSALLKKSEISLDNCPIMPDNFGKLIAFIADNTISGKIAKQVLSTMWEQGKNPEEIITQQGLQQISDTGAIESMVDQVINDNPAEVEQFKAGKTKLLGFFVGQVMKLSQGKANPAEINKILRQKLK